MSDPFGELRSLMQRPAPAAPWRHPGRRLYARVEPDARGDAWKQDARALLLAAHAADRRRYAIEMMPYVASFESHWLSPLATHALSSRGSMNFELLRVAPFASFAFVANSNALNGSRLREPAKFEPFAQNLLSDYTHVDLSDHAVFSEGARTIASSPHLAHVRHLALVGCHIRDEGLAELARSTSLSSIEVLDLSSNGITDEGVERACARWALERVRTLGLVEERVGERALRALATSEGLGALEEVWVDARLVDIEELERQTWWSERPNRFDVVALTRRAPFS